jgi:hypothetical protein
MSLIDGLPSLPSNVNIFETGELIAGDLLNGIVSSLIGNQWGIFFLGVPVVFADNILTMGRSKDSRIAKYPQERGAFASYNKVNMPATIRLRFSKGGSAAKRRLFIDTIEALENNTLLYEIVTPEKIYLNYNIIHTDYDRAAHNVGLVEIDVWAEEVRIAGQLQFSNTQNPSGASQQSGGLVQPVISIRDVDPSAQALASGVIPV